jgi:hypothetical protein
LRDYDVPEVWVRRVAMNLAADRGRGLGRHAKAMLKLRPPPEVLPVSVEALALAEALRTLPMRQRQVLVLHYLVDLPPAPDRPPGQVQARSRDWTRGRERPLVPMVGRCVVPRNAYSSPSTMAASTRVAMAGWRL